ncbi:uncharacterized protein LOC117333888 [Pecten maximus]|uniref:uncharacterized protein LOC117333888 n=1 Tax=Pecten maximus TaxID=6579 RepID=UPI0014581B36|nr:uncharacterized protein LOC117333888 [Pecten maximus]
MKTLLSSLVLAVFALCCVHGYSSFQTSIPNGVNVLSPCDDTTPWPGVGHEAMGGSVEPHSVRDGSDGDGISNGAELGDPNCDWTPGSNPAAPPSGFPGVCEPWSDPICLQKNTFNKCQTENMTCDAINSTVELGDFVNPLNTPYVCGMAGKVRCMDAIGGWSVGMPGLCHNENTGIKIGPTNHKYAVMQMHWNNPSERHGYTDSSGIILFYTPILRPYNLANLLTGEHIFSIPPGENRYVVESECSST